jgi:hypothetical protein
MKYQIDPHLRHDFPPLSSLPPTPNYYLGEYRGDHPPSWGGRPPRPPRPRSSPRRMWRRLALWWRRQEYRLGQWLSRHLPYRPEAQTAALQLLVLALTAVVLFQAVLLVLTAPR